MTMAKSLVTVTVDSVFRNFLIDEERYELLDTVEMMVETFQKKDILYVPAIKNERIKSFLGTTLENFALGATSMYRAFASDDRWRTVPDVVIERARRAAASLNETDLEIDFNESPEHTIHLWMWCLMATFLDELKSEHVKLEAKFGPPKQWDLFPYDWCSIPGLKHNS